MPNPVPIENIEEMRRREGIDDVELRSEIRDLQVGDSVRLTLMTGTFLSPAGETIVVRITSIKGCTFRGKLTTKPASACLAELKAGAPIRFTAAHIHSLPKEQLTHAE